MESDSDGVREFATSEVLGSHLIGALLRGASSVKSSVAAPDGP